MNRQKGFSLLEILIAFSILALSLGILLKIFSAGVNNAVVAEDYTAAVQIAESLMAKTGVESPFQAGQASGLENEKYHWQVEISPFAFNPENAGATETTANPENVDNPETTANPENIGSSTSTAELFKVKVIVSWGDDNGNDRQIELTNLKLVNKRL